MLGTSAKSWSFVAESTVTCHVDAQLLLCWRRCWQKQLRLACSGVKQHSPACAAKRTPGNVVRQISGRRKPQRPPPSTQRWSRSVAPSLGVTKQLEAPLSLVAKRVHIAARPTLALQLQRVDESVASVSTASLTPTLNCDTSVAGQTTLISSQRYESSTRHAGRLSLPALTLSSTLSRSRIASRRVTCSRDAREAHTRRVPEAAPKLSIVEEEGSGSKGTCGQPGILAVSPMKVHRRISAVASLSQRCDAANVGTPMLQPLVAEREVVPSGRGARIGNKRGSTGSRRGGKLNQRQATYESGQRHRLNGPFVSPGSGESYAKGPPSTNRRLTKAHIKFSPRQVLRNFL